MKEIERQLEIIKENTVDVIEESELKRKLERSISTGKPLRIKYGIDPTSPEIHLGHMVLIRKLRKFQQLGHKVLFLIGDFTARIGDPTGRNETRPILSKEEIKKNLNTYVDQVSKVLDVDKAEFVFNGNWLSILSLEEFIKIASCFTIAQILERDDFSARYKSGKAIYLHEFMYPLLQGYDSVVLESDIEIGATEQKFNLLAGRALQEFFGQEKQVVITMPILVGTDGKMKMSKSYKNHIPVSTTPDDMFGKIMSIQDALMESYARLLTDIDIERFKVLIEQDPRQAKAVLAKEIVSQFFTRQEAEKAEMAFDRVFKQKQIPENIPLIEIPFSKTKQRKLNIVDLLFLAGLVVSKSEAKRLIQQNAVKVDGRTITDINAEIEPDEKVFKVGKRKFGKIKIV
ncbi:MAG: tyrosine--tRNA ligase [Candidatus Omnitrophica bacterium]|nr:tyrosine--tRNA ligase [Candidatus Omnitrophota bacterium]MCM8816021.1 tyrosine--tRNA ligase [Candidatus Omnitrophota bacterium]